jgi:hypothetical protein
MEPLSIGVGEQIQSWCTRCRQMCGHLVAEVDRDRPVRVSCTSCRGEHLYRAQPPRSRTGVAARTQPREPADWEDLMAVADLGKVQSYAMRRDFSAGDVMSHRVFGLGIVVREVDGGKIQVSFQDGVRLLVCNRRH